MYKQFVLPIFPDDIMGDDDGVERSSQTTFADEVTRDTA